MFIFLFIISMMLLLWRLFLFGIRAAWGLSKMILTLVLLPVVLIGMAISGLLSLAFLVLGIIGVLFLIFARR